MRAVRSRFVSQNVASKSARKTGKSSSRGEEVSTNGENQAWAEPERRVPTRPNCRRTSAYRWGCSRMIRRIGLMNPRKCDLVPSNFPGRLTLGSRKWEESRLDVGGRLGSRLGCYRRLGSTGCEYREAPTSSSRKESRRATFSSWSCCKIVIIWLKSSVGSDIDTTNERESYEGGRWTNCHG